MAGSRGGAGGQGLGGGVGGMGGDKSYEDVAAGWDRTNAKTGSKTGSGIGGEGHQSGDLGSLAGYYGGVVGSGWGAGGGSPSTGAARELTPEEQLRAKGDTQQKDGSFLSPDGKEVVNSKGEVIGRATQFGGFMTTVAGYDWQKTPGVSGWDIKTISDPSNPNYSAYKSAIQESQAKAAEAAAAKGRRAMDDYVFDKTGYHFASTPKAVEAMYDDVLASTQFGETPDMRSVEAVAAYGTPEQAKAMTELVNNQIAKDRSFLGATFDFFTDWSDEEEGEYAARAMSPDAIRQQAKRGTLSTAMKGLSQGVLQTDKKGNLQDDKWGQFAEIADSTAGLLAAPFTAAIGGTLGTFLDEAVPTIAGQAMMPGISQVGAAQATYQGDPRALGLSMTGVLEPMADAYEIAQMRTALGLPRELAPATSPEEAGGGNGIILNPETTTLAERESGVGTEQAASEETQVATNTYAPSYSSLYTGLRGRSQYNPYAYSAFSFF